MGQSNPSHVFLDQWLTLHAELQPSQDALILDQTRISYGDLKAEVDQLSCALLAEGVRRGDRIATLSPPSPDYFKIFLASVQIGAIWVGLNPKYTARELQYVLGDSQPKLLFCRSHFGKRDYIQELTSLIASGIRLIALGAPENVDVTSYEVFLRQGIGIDQAALQTARTERELRDPCLIVYTSGSTGQPKGALLHHFGICSFSEAQIKLWPVHPLRSLNYFPINHIGCVIDISCPTLVAGGTLIFMEQFDCTESFTLMAREQVTLWGGVPSVFQMQLADDTFTKTNLDAVQLIVWEGAAMPRNLIERLLEIGPPLATNYGMTESSGAIAATPPTRDINMLANSVGPAFPGVDIRLDTSASGADADQNSGEICIHSDVFMLGYWQRREATDKTITEGWLRTGDLGRINPDGTLALVGRTHDMFKSGGYNVYPREVEDTLEAIEGVEVAIVVGIPDPTWSEVGIAFVACEPQLSEEVILKACQENLANYKIPKSIHIVTEMPLLPIGKIDKVTLRKKALELHNDH